MVTYEHKWRCWARFHVMQADTFLKKKINMKQIIEY